MKPFIKWAGGKEREIKFFSDYIPNDIHNYIEPFLGGGAVFFYLEDRLRGRRYINDYSEELINVYKYVGDYNIDFFNELDSICHNIDLMSEYSSNTFTSFQQCFNNAVINNNYQNELQDLVNECYLYNGNRLYTHLNEYDLEFSQELEKALIIKIEKARKLYLRGSIINEESISKLNETAFKMALYNTIRYAYNHIEDNNNPYKIAYFLYIREFCYAAMFRYNANGEFNVPYGGMSYNSKNFRSLVNNLRNNDELRRYLNGWTYIHNRDFEDFLNRIPIHNNDFIFVDPPYDSEFSEYAQNVFGVEEQTRLADCLARINANIMIVIKETDFIRNLYEERGFNIIPFDKKYNVNFQNRNDREVTHLIITNYDIQEEENG